MSEFKRCSKCNEVKEIYTGFYMCSGKWRAECKVCSIKRNTKYKQKHRLNKLPYCDDEHRKSYMRSYYSQNLEKFAGYRDRFRKKHPNYNKEYFLKCKNKTVEV